MPIVNPGYFGLVFRKCEETRSCVDMHKEHWSRFPAMISGGFNEDEHLIGFSVAMSGPDLDEQIDRAETMGAVLGRDFVATSSVDGVITDMPPWLLAQSGSDGLTYSFVAGHGLEA